MVTLFSFYGGRDKLHAPLSTLLQKNLWNKTFAKEPKSNQIAKQKFWSQLLLRAKFLVFGSKRANLATLLYYQSNNCRTATQALQYCLWRNKQNSFHNLL